MSDLFGTSVFGIRQFTSAIQQEGSLEGFVFTDNNQSNDTPTDIDWDELDLQMFDGTSYSEASSEGGSDGSEAASEAQSESASEAQSEAASETESDSSSDVSDEAQSEAAAEGEWIKTYDSESGEIVFQYYGATDSEGNSIISATFNEDDHYDSEGNLVSSQVVIKDVNSEAINKETGFLELNFGNFDSLSDATATETESEGGSEVSYSATYARLNLESATAPIDLKNNHEFTDVQGAEGYSNILRAGKHGSILRGGSMYDELHGRTNRKDVFVVTEGGDRIKNYGKGDRIRMGSFFTDLIKEATRIILKRISSIFGDGDVDDESDAFATNTFAATQAVVTDADVTSEGGSEATPIVYYNFDSEGNITLYANEDGSGDNLTIEGIKDPAGEYGTMGNRALRFTNATNGEDITWTFDADVDSEGSESSEGASDSSEGSETESEGASDGSEGSETESEGASDSSEGSETESEGASDSSEGSETESEGASDSSEGSETESEGASDSSDAVSEGASEGSIADIIGKSTSVDDIEKTLGLTTAHATLEGNSADNWWGTDELNIVGNSSTIAGGASATDLDRPLEVWLSNDSVKETQSADFSANTGVKKVHLKDGAQDVVFNPSVGGNFVDVVSNAHGDKNITLSNGGDAVLADMEADTLGGSVNILGGTGDDSVVSRSDAPVTFDMQNGGKDVLLTFAAANARVSLEGYNASTGAAIQVEEQGASVIADAVKDSLIGFGEGSVIIQSGDDKSKIAINPSEENADNGWIVNLKTPHKESDTVQAVGFTGKDGGTVDGSAYEKPLVMVGNMDGTKRAGSSLVGGSGNDTFFGGAGDTIVTGDGKDSVTLGGDSSRDGAVVNISQGRVTIDGSNNTLGGFTGDTIAIDELDITTTKFTYAGDSLVITGEDVNAVLTAVSSLEGGYMTQYIQNASTDVTYKAAIGAESSTIYIAEDDEARANAYLGKNSEVNFTRYTKDAFIDLGKDWAESYLNGERVYLEGVNKLVGGEGETVFKGSETKDTLIAGKGNTSIYGAGGLNVLGGYSGTDKEGSTTFFVIGGNEGAVHTINNFEYVGNNNFVDAAFTTADQLETDINNNHFSNVAIVDNDLLLEVTSNYTGETEKALLKDAIASDGYGKDFAVNGLVAQVGKDKVNVDDKADYYLAIDTNATVNVASSLTGDAIIWLNDDGRDMQFEGDFSVIDARNFTGKAELAGNNLDNVIYAGTGATSLWGGNGGNDLLVGGTGADNFYYAAGNGNDTISGTTSGDNINFLNLTLADISIDTITSSAVVLNFSDGGKLTVNDGGTGVNFKVGDATYVINSNREFEQK